MDAAQRQRILDMLWPAGAAGSVWAVLDCAREPAVYGALLASQLEFRCLFAGTIPREVEQVSPHLVELLRDHRLTARLLDEAWGRSWGVLMRVDDPSNLRHHLRKFLKVREEAGGRNLLFRWYDPRVLRDFLPTCTVDELQRFFGPIDAWYAESADGAGLHEYRVDARGLRRRDLGLPQPASA